MFLKEIGDIVSDTYKNGASLSLIAAGMSRYDRKRKADRQPRDTSGRWVGAGANVRWRSNGQDWAGTVEKMIDGKAVVKVRHSDGSESMTTLQPSTLKVMASKARLSSVNRKYFDENAYTSDYIAQHHRNLQKDAENGGARIERPDGYSVDVVADKEEEKKKNKDGNPLIYQLYAPNGQSKGIYSTPEGIDNAISADQSAEAVVSSGISISEDSPRAYTMPKDMKENMSFGLSAMRYILSDEDLDFFSSILSAESITKDEVNLLKDFMYMTRYVQYLYGGEDGIEWLEKLESNEKMRNSHDFHSGEFEYFVVQNNGYVDLIAVDYSDDAVYSWTGAGFSMTHGSIESYDAESIEPVDEDSAEKVSEQLTLSIKDGKMTELSVRDLFPEERNLFDLAVDEIDYAFLDRISSLSYDSADRSVDATQQSRGEAGKFADTGKSKSSGSGSKYFAIVDSVDPTAVLDIVVVSSDNGNPTVHRRSFGSWALDPDMLSELTGATPPNVIHLDSEEQIKEVLAQVDAYDAGEETTTDVDENTEFGFKTTLKDNLSSGILTDEDIHSILVKARKFNRMDLVPEDLRVYQNSITASGVYGEYGELIGADTVGDTAYSRLENYWVTGEGSKKIDWSSSDSVEYATKMFSKYVSSRDAFALATIFNSKANT